MTKSYSKKFLQNRRKMCRNNLYILVNEWLSGESNERTK